MGRSLQAIVKAAPQFAVGASVARTAGTGTVYTITEVVAAAGVGGAVSIRGVARPLPTAVHGAISLRSAIPSVAKADWRVVVPADAQRAAHVVKREAGGGWRLNDGALAAVAKGAAPFVGEQVAKRRLGWELKTARAAAKAATAAKASGAATTAAAAAGAAAAASKPAAKAA